MNDLILKAISCSLRRHPGRPGFPKEWAHAPDPVKERITSHERRSRP